MKTVIKRNSSDNRNIPIPDEADYDGFPKFRKSNIEEVSYKS